MPRNVSGTYSLPAGNPVVTGTTIASTWANTTLDDLKAEMTDSLSRSGKGAMLAALALVDGAVGTPGLTFATELSTGLYRPGAGQLGFAVGGARQFNLSSAAPAAWVKSFLAGADAGDDVLMDSANARTNGNLLKVANAGASKFRVAFGGAVGLGGSGIILMETANTGLTLLGNRDAADAGTDVTLNSQATRTSGNLLAVSNNGGARVEVGFNGTVWLSNSGAVAARTANLGLILQGNRNAADAGADVLITSSATRTAGTLLVVNNNGVSRFYIAADGTVGLLNSGTISTADTTNLGMTLRGNKNAADTGTDVVVGSTATRTAGSLLDVQNNGTSKLSVDFGGNVIAAGWLRPAAAETTTVTAGTNWTLSVNSVRRSAGVVTVRFQGSATVPAAAFNNIGTVPAGYRPPTTILPFGWVVDLSGGATFGAEFQIDTAGLVQIVNYDNGTSLVAPFAIGNGDSCDLVVSYVL